MCANAVIGYCDDRILEISYSTVTPPFFFFSYTLTLRKWGQPSTLTKLAKKLNLEVVQWINGFHNARALNIVMVDHYHTCDFVKLVVQLNFTTS